MPSVTIIISHYESLAFLKTCVRQIKKMANPEIEQKIIICDQSSEPIKENIIALYANDADVKMIFTKPLWSGYGIDYCMRYADIKTDYVCQIHCDCIPISNKWLYLPIKLLEGGFKVVGQMQLISLPTDTIYPPGNFFSMAAAFNMARTDDYRELALNGGFTRFHNRWDAENGMTWESGEWHTWAIDDYYHRGSDDDVPAFHWEDKYREHDKLGLAITGMIATHYGRIIEDIIFHFCSCRESKEGSIFGDEYARLYKQVHENYSDELVEEMLSMIKPSLNMNRVVWDGKTKTHSAASDELNNKIEQLKK
jgi:glycosyltransferase involved in cell wall biosynthesis